MDDPRNHLAWDYVRFLERVKPDGFVFENVTGLLNIQGGKVFASVKEAFASVMPSVHAAVIAVDEYAIPQRRKRLILVGRRVASAPAWVPPEALTSTTPDRLSLFRALEPSVSVEEAIGDLPYLAPGENGSHRHYAMAPSTVYQALMRNCLLPAEYLHHIANGKRAWPIVEPAPKAMCQSSSKVNSART